MKNNTKALEKDISKNKVDEKIKTFFKDVKNNKSDNEAFIRLANK